MRMRTLQMRSQTGDLTGSRSHDLELRFPDSVHWLKGLTETAIIQLKHDIVSDFL